MAFAAMGHKVDLCHYHFFLARGRGEQFKIWVKKENYIGIDQSHVYDFFISSWA